MVEEKSKFISDNFELDASFYLPDASPDLSKPLILVCSGFMGLKTIHPERFARGLTRKGYCCFGFDYRGFGKSEGKKGRVVLEDQIADIVNAADFVKARADGLGSRLVLLGWGMAGGLILESARAISDLSGLICVNGFYDGIRVQKTVRGEQGWKQFISWIESEKASGNGKFKRVDPFQIYPLDFVTRQYVDNVLTKNGNFGGAVDIELADSLLRFAPESRLEHLKEMPALIAHGDRNLLHPVIEAHSLYQRYPGPKELYWIPAAGHTEWVFDDNPVFLNLINKIETWLNTSIASKS